MAPSRRTVRQYVAAFISSIAVLMCGSTIGWITPIIVWFKGPKSEIPMTSDESSWVASIIELGNFFTPLPSGILVDKIGRKPCLLSIAPMYIASWLLVLTTRSVFVLYIARIIQGFAMGIVFTVLPMYLAEIAGPDIRGTLSTFFQGMFFTGIQIQYCIGPYVSYQNLAYISLTFPVIFLATFIWMPESPYYLIMKNQDVEAGIALAWLRGEDSVVNVDDELKAIKCSVADEMANKKSWTDVISSKTDRRALMIALIVALSEIMSGITAVLTYASQTFNSSESKAFLTPDEYTIILGFLIVFSTVFAAGQIDTMGRRPLLLGSSIGCAVFEFLTGVYYFLLEKTDIYVSKYNWIAFILISAYCVVLASGLGATVATVQGELFPANTRGIASAVIATSVTILSFFWMKIYQVISDNIGIYLNYFIFSACCIISTILIYFLVPETKGKTLAEIQINLVKKTEKIETNDVILEDISTINSIKNEK
ncbi:facilitated trehalose transporter Tret1-like [Lycorma delicatula]|uniref:facilitated trehalose transporter Tret1-like n=1 Tax=Lycorma delicatula TaxID=130591 RepID=UPI003F50E8DD